MCTSICREALQGPVWESTFLTRGSPLSETSLGQAGDDDGVKGLLCAGDGDAQRAAIPLQLHCVDDGAGRLLLVWMGDKDTGNDRYE